MTVVEMVIGFIASTAFASLPVATTGGSGGQGGGFRGEATVVIRPVVLSCSAVFS